MFRNSSIRAMYPLASARAGGVGNGWAATLKAFPFAIWVSPVFVLRSANRQQSDQAQGRKL